MSLSRREFLRSLGVALIAPVAIARALSKPAPNRIVNADVRWDNVYLNEWWPRQSGKTAVRQAMMEWRMRNGSSFRCGTCDENGVWFSTRDRVAGLCPPREIRT